MSIDHVAAEALQLLRSAVARVGPPALPRDTAVDEDIRARCTPTCSDALPQTEPALALAGARCAGPEKSWGIIEID